MQKPSERILELNRQLNPSAPSEGTQYCINMIFTILAYLDEQAVKSASKSTEPKQFSGYMTETPNNPIDLNHPSHCGFYQGSECSKSHSGEPCNHEAVLKGDGKTECCDKCGQPLKYGESKPCEHEWFDPEYRGIEKACSKCGLEVSKPCDLCGGKGYILGAPMQGCPRCQTKPSEPCEHEWAWSNNTGKYYCQKCDDWSNTGTSKPSKTCEHEWIKHCKTGEIYCGLCSITKPSETEVDAWYKRLEYNSHTRKELKEPSVGKYTEKFIRLEYAFNIFKEAFSIRRPFVEQASTPNTPVPDVTVEDIERILSEMEDTCANNWGVKNIRRSFSFAYTEKLRALLERKGG